jgi:Co/Zn/Cd efflux system component
VWGSQCRPFVVRFGGLFDKVSACLAASYVFLACLWGICNDFYSLTAVWLAEKPANAKLTFGYHRYEVLGAVTSVFLIWFITGILVYEAIDRIIHPEKVDGAPPHCAASFA